MERAAAALSGAARAKLASALSTLPSGPRVLHVEDDLYCPATRSSPLLSLFTTGDALQRAHGVSAVLPLSQAAQYCSSSQSSPQTSHVFLLRANASAAVLVVDALTAIAHTSEEALAAASLSSSAPGSTGAPNSAGKSGKNVKSNITNAAATAAPSPADLVEPKALVLITPRRSNVIERLLKKAPSTSISIRIAALPLAFLPFDDGLVTLHWPRSFPEVVLEGNNSSILACAAALNNLADVLDIDFTTVRSVGKAAAATVKALLMSQGGDTRSLRGSTDAPASLSVTHLEPSSSSWSNDADDTADTERVSVSPADSSPRLGPVHPSASMDMRATSFPMTSDSHESSFELGTAEDWFKGEVTMAKATRVATSRYQPGSSKDDVIHRASIRRKPVTLLILDRNVDVVTPLLTQWTYEGLLDEAVGLLRGNVMDIGFDEFISEDASGMLCQPVAGQQDSNNPSAVEKLKSTPSSGKRVQKRLRRDGDPVFGQLRDLNYFAAARKLRTVAFSVQAYYDARPGRETAEIGQVKDYVRGLRDVKTEHRSAAVHTAIAAEISARTFEQAAFKRRFELEREMLDGSNAIGRRVVVHDSIARNEPLPHVLRLCCLWSITGGGVDSEAFEFIRREIIATYGLSVLSLLGNLERAGLFVRSARVQTQSGLPWNPFGNPFANLSGGDQSAGFGGGSSVSTPPRERPVSLSSPDQSGADATGSSRPTFPSSVVGYSWQFVRAAMRLMNDFDPESSDGGGLFAPYSGYVPLTVRLIEAGVSPVGWSKLPSVANHTLLLPPGHEATDFSKPAPWNSVSMSSDEGTSGGIDIDAVVLFVGGIARAEASAIRAVSKQIGKKILIASTDVCGANQFVTMT